MEDEEQLKRMEKTLQLLRIPDAIKEIPPYDGNRTDLNKFIKHVDDIVTILRPAFDKKVHGNILIRAIRNKIIGNADKALEMYNTKNEWGEMKQNLISHFADKRDETSLIRDLHNLHQRGDPVEVYFSRILEITNALKNWAALNTTDNNETGFKSKWYDEMGLAVFVSNLRDPLGSMVRAMKPADLPTARIYCLKEQNTVYMRNKVFGTGQSVQNTTKPLMPPRVQMYKPNYDKNPHRQTYNNQFYNTNQNFHPPRNNNQYFNHRPFTNNNQFANVRGLPPKPDQRKFEPMDTSSNTNNYKKPIFAQQIPQNSNNPHRYNFNSNGQPRFQSKELYNIYTNPYDHESDHYYEPYEENVYNENHEEKHDQYTVKIPEDESPIIEIEDEDFHQTSSEDTVT